MIVTAWKKKHETELFLFINITIIKIFRTLQLELQGQPLGIDTK